MHRCCMCMLGGFIYVCVCCIFTDMEFDQQTQEYSAATCLPSWRKWCTGLGRMSMHTFPHALLLHVYLPTCTPHTCTPPHMHTSTHAHLLTCTPTHPYMHTPSHAQTHTSTHPHMHTSSHVMPVARGGSGSSIEPPSEGQGTLMWKYGTGPGRSSRRLEAF